MSCTCGWENCNCDKNSYTKAALNGYGTLTKSQVDSLLDPTWLRDLTIRKRRKSQVGKGKTMKGRGVAIPKDLQGIMNTKFVRDLIEKKRKAFEEEIRREKRKKKTFF